MLRGLLLRVGYGRISDPSAILIGFHPRAQPLLVARPGALDHPVELVPVDLAEVVMAFFLVPTQIGIGTREAKVFARFDQRTAGAENRWYRA